MKFRNLKDDLKKFIMDTNFFTIDEYGFVVDEHGCIVYEDDIIEQKTYFETGEL